jgi:uncharacterized repeat protein (TIGR02543 family)
MLIMLLTLGVGQMWAADMYIKGERNSWNFEKMTEEVSGSKWTFIAYWQNGTDYDAFKITSKTDWSGLNLGGNGSNVNLSWGTKSGALYDNGGSKDIILPSLPTGGAVVKITVTKESSSYYVKAEKLSEEGNSWVDINAPKIYWDNTNATYTNVSMLNGRVWAGYDQALGSVASALTHISNTNLWYNTSINNVGNAGKYTTTLFVNANWSSWETNVATKRAPYATSFTASNTTSLNSNTYLYSAASGNKGATLSRSQLSSGYSELNKTQTIEVYVKAAGGSYTKKTSSWPGTLTPDRYYLSNATTATHVDNTPLTASSSVTVSAVLTSAFSLSESATATGYNFDGWGTSSGATPSGKNAPYSISAIRGANTICAFFSEKTYTVTVNNDGHGTTSPSGAQSNKGQITGVAISATPNDGYEFVNWTIESGTGSFGNTTSASTTFYPTSAATIRANFRSIATNSLTVAAGAHVGTVTGSTDPVTLGNSYAISASNFDTGYEFYNWTASPAANATFANASSASTNVTVVNGSVTVTANARERMSTLSTSCSYDAGNPSYAIPTKTVSSIGISTTANLSATAPSTGYTFVGWTLTHCVRTSGEANSRNITIRSDGSGEAASAVANYEEDLNTTWYISGATGTNYPFTGWGTSGTRMSKKSGHSTEEIYYCNITVNRVASGDEYEFQTYNSGNSTYYGYNGKDIDKAHNSTTVYSSNPTNMKFKPYVTGTYEFKVDNTGANPVLTVTWPIFNQVRISSASPTDATNTGNFDLSDPVSNVRTVTRSLKANTTYTFKIMYNSDWYGYNSGTFTRSTSTSSNSRTLSTSGGNLTLTTDYAGDYTFRFNQSTKALSVDFPTAYKVTYGKGTVDGSTGSCSAKDIDNGNAAVTSNSTWVKSGNRVVLTAPEAKAGYTYNGWFDNNSGTGDAITTNANCTITVSSALTRYACYTINNYAITHSASTHGNYTIQVGSAAAVSTSTTSDYGKTITLAATPATGYHFDSWSAYKTGTPATTVTVTSNQFTMPDYAVTVGATFTPTTYSITYHTNGGSAIATGNYNIETATFALPTTSEKTGYTFAGWYTNAELTGDPVASIEVGSYGNKEYWAKWDANEYTITLDNQYSDGQGSDGIHEGDVDATHYVVTFGTNWFDHYMLEAPSHGHYTFMGYWSAAGGAGTQILSDRGELLASTPYTDAEGKWTYPNNVTIYAKWSENQELNKNAGVTAGATHGAITLTYNSSAVSGYTASTRKGYLLDGYFTAASDGNEVITNTGVLAAGPVANYIADGKWIYENPSAPDIYAQWTPVTYTVRFAKNTDASYLGVETGTDPDNIAATYDAAITLPANPYTRPGYEFLGWAKAQYKAKGSYNAEYPLSDYQYASGEHNYNISATQDSIAVLYPKWVGNVYTVSFNPRGASVYPTSMNVRYGETYGSGNSGSLPEPSSVPTGKTFVGWFTSAVGGTQVTAETQLRTIGAHTLYAHYEDLTQVYFKNTIGWDEVYVTYAAYWDTYNNPSKGTGNNGCTYNKMRRVPGTTDVYYDQVPASIVASWTGGNEKIAFNSQELLTDKEKHAPTTGDYNNYNVGEVVYRMDFDSRATMFVPTNNNGTTADGNYVLNGAAQYRSTGYKEGTSSDPEYTSGYWMIFNNTYSGYLFSYQKDYGSWSAEYGMNGAKAGDSVFVYSVKMDANTRYDLRIRKDCQTTNTKSRQFCYGTQITSSACTDLKLVCDPNNNSWMQTTAAGEYKFILTTKSDGHMYLTVEYPLAVNDYRVLYNYNDGSAKEYASEVIKPIAKDTVDTISVFVHKLQAPVVSRSMKIQKCTAINGSGVPTWSDVATGTIDLSSVTANGVYNFAVQQYESGTPTGAFIGKYDGDFYIRTEASDGGWDQYKDRADNVMTYSAYSMTQTLSEPYSHYYCRYVGSTSTDITFAVATKYSPNISGTMIGDAIIGNAATTLPANANVRFSYNEQTNDLERAYIKPAQGTGNERFLVMHGKTNDMILDEDGDAIPASGSLAANELQFDDMGDWVYQVMLQAKPNAQISLIAKYNNADRYLIGGASEHEKILGGEGSNKYTIMAIYDFKTNRLMNAWTPDGEISDKLSDIDMLWIRRSDNEAKQITFSGDGSLTKVKVVGAIQLRYNDLVGRVSTWSYETRPLLKYFLSFPFDVNVSDIFGLHGAELGREYVIQKYNAAERAKNGLFLGDGDTYWENLTADSVMHANEGYCLIFDNEYLNGDLGTIWENKAGGSSVYLYFPASHELPSISDEDKGTSLASHLCENTRTYTYGGGTISHANSDSHWNLIGSPLFANSYVIESDGTNGQTGTAARTTLDSYYAYDGHYNVWVPTLYYSEATGKYYACKAMHAMLVQFAGSVTWSKNEPAAPASVVARQKHETTNRLITLNLMQGDEEGDHTYIKMDENGNTDFMLCEDMFKIINKNKPNIFSYAGTNCVAYNKVQVEDMTVNLGVEIRKNGTYTFTMPDNVAGQVTLIDNFAQTRTNLNIDDYEIYLNKGNYYDRFSIEIKVNKVPTAIDGVTDGQGSLKDGKAHKFIMNDQMYILKDGVLYDARGNRVK